jgi:integrase
VRGLYRPRVPSRVPRSVPDEEFNGIFARLPSHRDRALVAFYVSTGARVGAAVGHPGRDGPGRQLITVIRKGSGELQELPASTDAFVWLRLYQVEMEELVPRGGRQPLWWTLRRPARPLSYHAVHRMFERAGEAAGSSATLHGLRHTAAYRMAEDNIALEAAKRAVDGMYLPLHGLCLRDMGMMFGEMWNLEALGADCAADGVYDFQLTAPPLRVTGAVGSPINPIAVK